MKSISARLCALILFLLHIDGVTRVAIPITIGAAAARLYLYLDGPVFLQIGVGSFLFCLFFLIGRAVIAAAIKALDRPK